MNEATCLSLLSNAVPVWKTIHMMRIIQQLRASGETMTAEELARVRSFLAQDLASTVPAESWRCCIPK